MGPSQYNGILPPGDSTKDLINRLREHQDSRPNCWSRFEPDIEGSEKESSKIMAAQSEAFLSQTLDNWSAGESDRFCGQTGEPFPMLVHSKQPSCKLHLLPGCLVYATATTGRSVMMVQRGIDGVVSPRMITPSDLERNIATFSGSAAMISGGNEKTQAAQEEEGKSDNFHQMDRERPKFEGRHRVESYQDAKEAYKIVYDFKTARGTMPSFPRVMLKTIVAYLGTLFWKVPVGAAPN